MWGEIRRKRQVIIALAVTLSGLSFLPSAASSAAGDFEAFSYLVFSREGNRLLAIDDLTQSSGAAARVTRHAIQEWRSDKWVTRDQRKIYVAEGREAVRVLRWRIPDTRGRVSMRLVLYSGKRRIFTSKPQLIQRPGVPLKARSVEVSSDQACAIDLRNRLRCWGDGYAFPGVFRITVSARQVKAAGRVSQVSLGWDHMCTIGLNRLASCWGSSAGQALGTGGETDPDRPARVLGLGQARQISAGADQTCALPISGRPMCWGLGGYDVIGAETHEFPHPVRGMKAAMRIDAGNTAMCAVGGAGRPVCFGYNRSGLLGIPGGEYPKLPRRVKRLRQVRDVQTETEHSCAITKDRRMYCWGENKNGELGDGTTKARTVPTRVKKLGKVRDMSVDDSGMCAVEMSGSAWCWGWSGIRNDGSVIRRKIPVRLGRGIRFRSISGTGTQGCGVTVNQLVRCWGDNEWGFLGNGTRVSQPGTGLVFLP